MRNMMCFHESKWVRFEDTKIVGWYKLNVGVVGTAASNGNRITFR